LVDEESECGGVDRFERLEELGIGQGVPGKVGKNLFTHFNPVEIDACRCDSAPIEREEWPWWNLVGKGVGFLHPTRVSPRPQFPANTVG